MPRRAVEQVVAAASASATAKKACSKDEQRSRQMAGLVQGTM